MKGRGFTLVELSIVLVVIGIILAIAVKGLDMIGSAKTKKVVEFIVKSERSPLTAFRVCYERSSFSYPVAGDTDGDGLIDTDPLSASCSTGSCRCLRNLVSSWYFSVSDRSFYIFPGTEDIDADGLRENVLFICLNSTCSQSYSDQGPDSFPNSLRFAQSFDSDIDPANDPVGVVDDREGYVRGARGVTVSANLITSAIIDTTSSDTTKEWDGNETAIAVNLNGFLGIE